MAHLDITDDHVDVRLTQAEKLFALRGDYRFARPAADALRHDPGDTPTELARPPRGAGIRRA